MGTQTQTNAERQAAFRLRQKASGAQRLNVWLSGPAHAVLKRQSVRDGVPVARIVERLALDAHATNQRKNHD
jgi:hypothetical protein